MTAPKPDGPTGLMTDEEIMAIADRTPQGLGPYAHMRKVAHAVEREARERQRREDAEIARAFGAPMNPGAVDTGDIWRSSAANKIANAILRNRGEP